MNQRQVRNLTASIRDRLRIQARERNEEFQLILTQYAIDRLLYRLSSSPHADRFVLKGAILVSIWGGGRYRVTRDVDLLKLGSSELDHIETLFREVCEALVCPTCREEYVSPEVSARVLAFAEQAFRKGVTLDVRYYAGAA